MSELETYEKINKELRIGLYSIRKELEEAKECINMFNAFANDWHVDMCEKFINHSLEIIDELGE